MKVALLVTGRTEHSGLARLLDRIFPGNEFYALPDAEEVQSHPASFPFAGFTSTELKPVEAPKSGQPPPALPEAVKLLVQRAAREALGDARRNRKPADLVVILDDLELANLGQESVAIAIMRAAASQHIDGLSSGVRERTETALRERVSFHLAVPMIEAWFFADHGALTNAGVPPTAPALLGCTNVEDFLATDAGYDAASAQDCPCWARKRDRKTAPKWLGQGARNKHPKGYLQWLCLDGESRGCTAYREVDRLGVPSGGHALANLALGLPLAGPPDSLHYLRALLADLEDGLGQAPNVGTVVEHANEPALTSLRSRGPSRLIRNL